MQNPCRDGTVTLYIGRAYLDALYTLIDNARHSILSMQYIVPPRTDRRASELQTLYEKLIAARQRDVDITVLLHYHTRTVHHHQTANELTSYGIHTYILPMTRTLHAKCWAIDNNITLLSTHNLTTASVTRNYELAIQVDSPLITQTVREFARRLIQLTT